MGTSDSASPVAPDDGDEGVGRRRVLTATASLLATGGAAAFSGTASAETERSIRRGRLDGPTDEVLYAYVLPDNAMAAKLELGMPQDADFDMYATFDGRWPSRRNFDKRSDGRANKERILVRDPRNLNEELTILVRSYEGSGEYRLGIEIEYFPGSGRPPVRR